MQRGGEAVRAGEGMKREAEGVGQRREVSRW